MKELSLLLGLTLLLTFVALGYSKSCEYLIRNNGSTSALISGSIIVSIAQGGHNTTYMVTCYPNITDCIDCTDNKITGTFNGVVLANLANRNESLRANIIYEFKADTKKQEWFMSNMTISVNETSVNETSINETSKNGTSKNGTSVNGTGYILEGWVDGYKYIMNNVTLDYQRSYQCNANMTFAMNCSNMTTDSSNMTTGSSNMSCHMYVSFVNFQVQAFSFYDKNPNTFGNEYMCDADTTGSKIVPIAVGIALAVLVCIVLVAYLIGRLKSRRQSSYETLK